MVNIGIRGSFTIFADDTTLLWRGSDFGSLRDVIVRYLVMLKEWCNAKFLSFNANKSNILTFKFDLDNLYIGSNPLKNDSTTKFLGLHIDRDLKFNNHIVSLNRRIASGCYAIRTISNELGSTVARTSYFALIESHLRYGIAFWGFCSLQLFFSVFVLQKRALRYISKVRSKEHCKPLFIKEKILTLYSLFILESSVLVHRKYKNHSFDDRAYNLRNTNIPLPIPKTSLTRNSIIYEGIKIYNHLPQGLRTIKEERQFKKGLKRLLLARPYYCISEFFEDSFDL